MAIIEGTRRSEITETNDPIPDGTYRCRIAKVKLVDPSDPSYQGSAKAAYLNVDHVITEDGEFLGRHVFNIVTLEGGKRFQLRQLLEAIDYPENDDLDTERMEDAEVMVVVGTEPAKGEYEARNRVRKYISIF